LRDILRQKLEFEGIVITDDMEMDAITRYIDLGEAAVQSIKAGADIVLISTHGYHVPLIVKSIEKALQEGRLTEKRLDESVIKIVELKLRYEIMDLVNGAIIPSRVPFSEKEHKLLSESEKINEKVSREAIYFHGTGYALLPTFQSKARSIFITDDPFLTRVISRELTKTKIVKNGAHCIQFCNSHLKAKSSNVFYHVEKLNRKELLRMIAYTERHKMRLIIVCTGNPFILSGISSLPPVLFSFSNTSCSKRAMIRCLRGDYSPRTKININLGF
jgi:beta-glucosidase-like glycosyl hydrolase